MHNESDSHPATVRPRPRSRLRRLVGKVLRRSAEDMEKVAPGVDPIELDDEIRVDHGNRAFRLILGKSNLQVVPDISLSAGPEEPVRDWLVASADVGAKDGAPDEAATFVPFVRLKWGDNLVIGRSNEELTDILRLRKSVGSRCVALSNGRAGLVVEPLDSERRVAIAPLNDDAGARRIGCRLNNLRTIADILGGMPDQLPKPEAKRLIGDVLAILEKEAYRKRDSEGRPGGLLELPPDKAVMIVGDMHGRVDNLLRSLIEDGILSMLRDGSACVVVLGDAFHREEPGYFDDMESSVVMLDLLLALKKAFPRNFFYIRGNHDSFSQEISKGGVLQGEVFRKRLKELRGSSYVKLVQAFFNGIAYVATGRNFVCCHAAPPRSAVPRQMLIDIRKYPGVAHELVNGRIRTQARLAGYRKRDVRAFRASLGLDRHAPFIVGHTPVTLEDTLWSHVGGVRHHHVVYSAQAEHVGVFMQNANGVMIPQVYRAEPLSDVLKNLLSEHAESDRAGDDEAAG